MNNPQWSQKYVGIPCFQGKYKGKPDNLQLYLKRGYRYSEERKKEIRSRMNLRRFIGCLIPQMQEEFHQIRRINNFQKL